MSEAEWATLMAFVFAAMAGVGIGDFAARVAEWRGQVIWSWILTVISLPLGFVCLIWGFQ